MGMTVQPRVTCVKNRSADSFLISEIDDAAKGKTHRGAQSLRRRVKNFDTEARRSGGTHSKFTCRSVTERVTERGRESFRRPSRKDDSRPPFLSLRPLLFPCFAWTA